MVDLNRASELSCNKTLCAIVDREDPAQKPQFHPTVLLGSPGATLPGSRGARRVLFMVPGCVDVVVS